MPESGAFAATLTGRIAEYQALLAAVDEGTGLTVLSCVPASGASSLLAAAAEESRNPCLLVDARRCRDSLDLGMAIADAAVRALAPEAASWWFEPGTRFTTEALRVHRALSLDGIELEDLRVGGGQPLRRIDEALRLACALADAEVTVAVDHLGPLLWQEGPRGTRELLGQLRACLQDLPLLSLILADFADGPVTSAIADSTHPMFRGGEIIEIARAKPQRFVDDLAITRPTTSVPIPLLYGCAELTAGVPVLTWHAVELADPALESPAAALSGWDRLRRVTEPSTAHQWDALRRVHPLAQNITAVVASGLRPYGTIAANDKSIGDAMRVMRALGLAWQPGPQRWAISDPLLAAYGRDHAPPWLARRSASIRAKP